MQPIIEKVWSNEITELTDRLKRINSSDKANASYFVFKSTNEILNAIKKDDRIRNEIVERSNEKPIYILIFNKEKKHYIAYEITKEKIFTKTDKNFINEIRTYDLKEVIDRTSGDCFLNAPHGIHFVTPSGKHVIRFLRLTDAIYSYNALDRISFWLQSHVAESSAVIIDTWSISSIVLRTLQLLGSDIPFDCFHEHVKSNHSLALEVLNKISRRITDDKPILFLVGISSSGEFFNALPDLLEKSSIENEFKSLSIYGFNNTPEKVNLMARLDVNITLFDQDNCEYCQSNDRKTTYEIDSKYYYPRKHEEKPVRFTKNLLIENGKNSSAKEFIQQYGHEVGVLLVHKDDLTGEASPRHHAFYINVVKLMSISSFVHDLNKVINKIESENDIPEIIISPKHEAAESIINHLKQKWRNSTFIYDFSLRNLSCTDLKKFRNARHICFIDDAVITGTRIERCLRDIREKIGEDVLGNLKTISWFPLVLRTASEGDVEKIKDSLSGHNSQWKNKLYYVLKIMLPNWMDKKECPWCQEEKILDKHVGPLWAEPKWYKKRRLLLRDMNSGISKEALFVQPLSDHTTLGAGSPIGDEGSHEMQVLFLLANGLQILRTDSNLPLGVDNFFNRNCLFWKATEQDPKCGTFERFSEPLIQSCFLRVVKLEEWSKSIWDNNERFLEDKIKSGNCNELIGEAILFYTRHSSDKKMKKDSIDKIRSICEDEAIKKLLSTIEE